MFTQFSVPSFFTAKKEVGFGTDFERTPSGLEGSLPRRQMAVMPLQEGTNLGLVAMTGEPPTEFDRADCDGICLSASLLLPGVTLAPM